MTLPAQRILILFLSLIFAVVLSVIAFWNSMEAEATKAALIWTGRAAFFVFLVPFFASPLRTLIKNKFTLLLMRWRRNSGIVYGGIQVIHLFVIAWYFKISATQPVDNDMLYIGGLGLALVMVMLITSFDGPTKAIGRKNWKIIHKSGFYVCSFIYFFDFVIEPFLLGTAADYVPYALVTLAAMLVRTIVMLKPKPQPRQQAV
jgi:DMSO/TMAO reductase YedYZ heme-binding membrane subunit